MSKGDFSGGHWNCFPAWVETSEAHWLVDKDVANPADITCPFCQIRSVHRLGYAGIALSMFPIPRGMVADIRSGKMKKIMLAHGTYQEIHVDDEGHLHREDGPAVVYQDGSSFWYHHGKRIQTAA